MSLKDWAKNSWLRPHQTSAQEVAGLLSIVDRDLEDARQTRNRSASEAMLFVLRCDAIRAVRP